MATPQHGVDSTPLGSMRVGGNFGETPTPSRMGMMGSTPMVGAGETPGSARRKHFWETPVAGQTPGNFLGMTPTPGAGMTPFLNMAPE
jgi:hypothetical protein